jgi:uncharacterized protein
VPAFADFAAWFDEAFAVAQTAGTMVDFPSFRLAGPPQSTFCGTCQSPFSITPDGLVSACYEACWAGAAHADRLMIGRYDSQTHDFRIDAGRLAQLRQRNVNNLDGCRDCFCKYACAGDCPVRNWRAIERAGVLDTGARCDLIRAIGKTVLRRVLNGSLLASAVPAGSMGATSEAAAPLAALAGVSHNGAQQSEHHGPSVPTPSTSQNVPVSKEM